MARAVEGRGQHVNDDLLGEGRGVHDHGVHAAGFSDQRGRTALRIQTGGDVALQQGGHFGRTGKHHAAHAVIGGQFGADRFTAPWQQLHHARRYARFQQNVNALGGNQRGLLCRFCQHAVACGQRCGNLAGEDRQREVPRADTHHRAERTVGFVVEIIAHLTGVVVQEVDRLAHFGDGVAEGFTRFTHQNADQLLHLIFHQHRRAFQNGGTLLRRSGKPDWRVVHRALQGLLHFRFRGFAHVADDILRLCRVDHRLHFTVFNGLLKDRFGLPLLQCAVKQGGRERRQTVFVGEIQTRRVDATCTIQLARQGNLRMRQTNLAFLRRHLLNGLYRVGHQFVQRQGGIGDAVNEGGVRPVLQQTTHQVGQQGFVCPNRGINTARTVQLAVRHFTGHLLVQRFTHAVQALELVLAWIVVLTREAVDRRQGMGVVGGELRINQVRHAEQLFRTGEVRDVGVNLAGIDRITFQTFHLGAFDFAVPVGAFYQADHQAATATACQVNQVINDERAAFLVGLDDETNPVPARQLRLEAQFFQQIEGDLQTVRLFGVDVDADVILARQQGQGLQARVEFFHHPVVLRAAVARVQGGKLDRDAWPFINTATVGRFTDGVDRLLVRDHVGLRVGGGQRRFTQHIVGVAEAFIFQLAGVRQRFGNGFPGDELLAHQAHRHVHALADQRLAALADDAVQGARQVGFVMGGDQLAGEQQAPGGGVNEQGRAAANVGVPVAVADFVADQGIAGGFIRNTQQRFRQTHQRHAFLRGEGELLQQPLHHTGASAGGFLITQLVGELICQAVRLSGNGFRQARLLQQHRHGVGFGTAIGAGNGGAADGLRQDLLGKFQERLVILFNGRRGLFAFVRCARQQGRQLRQTFFTLQSFQIVKNRLLD